MPSTKSNRGGAATGEEAPAPTFFATPAALRRWFARHGATSTVLWIGYYKKGAGRGGVVYKQALDEALCVGWIDGLVKSLDAARYMQRWTPRKPRSIWSAVNTRRVAELEAEGRMQPAGRAAFALRDPKRAGIYSFENKPVALDPADERRFRASPGAWTFFQAQPPGYRRTALYWVMCAKQAATRTRRLEALVASSAEGERLPHLSGKPARRPAGV